MRDFNELTETMTRCICDRLIQIGFKGVRLEVRDWVSSIYIEHEREMNELRKQYENNQSS